MLLCAYCIYSNTRFLQQSVKKICLNIDNTIVKPLTRYLYLDKFILNNNETVSANM